MTRRINSTPAATPTLTALAIPTADVLGSAEDGTWRGESRWRVQPKPCATKPAASTSIVAPTSPSSTRQAAGRRKNGTSRRAP